MVSPSSPVLCELQLLNLRVLRGPNLYRSDPVIACDVRLGSPVRAPEQWLSDLYVRIEDALQQMHLQPCSRGSGLTFRDCLRDLAELPHIIEHIGLGLQILAGANVSYGHVERAEDPHTWVLAVDYEEEPAGLASLRLALQIVQACLTDQPFEIEPVVGWIQQSLASSRPDVATAAILREAKRRGIPARRLGVPSLVQLGLGRNLRRINGVLSDRTSAAAVQIAQDREAARHLLLGAGLPAQPAVLVATLEQAVGFAQKIGYPVALEVTHPAKWARAFPYLDHEQALRSAWPKSGGSVDALIEGSAYGRDYAVLVVDGHMRSGVERISAAVRGDGHCTIRDLMQRTYPDAAVEDNSNVRLTLSAQGRSLDSVPEPGDLVILPAASASADPAGVVMDRSDEIHPENRIVCEASAKTLGLSVAAVELRSPNLSVPWSENGGGIVRVDPMPDLNLHANFGDGAARAIACHLIETMYGPGSNATIPIVAVTGTNGKTTTTRLIAHLLVGHYGTVGLKTTDGVYVGGRTVVEGDVVSALAGALLLSNPEVDAAVIEAARGGILSHGVGFERANVGVILNVSSDHLGSRGVESLEQLARVKGVIGAAVSEGGHLVLNADDPLVYAMRERTAGNIVLLSTRARSQHPALANHEGLVACVEDETYVLYDGQHRIPLAKVAEVPLTFAGAARFQDINVLAASAAAYVLGIPADDVAAGVVSFSSTPETNPGRMNLLQVNSVSVLVDYAHNVAALQAVVEFARTFPARKRLAVLGVPADRRDQDIRACGRVAAGFDFIILRERDQANPGPRRPGEVARLLAEGLEAAGMCHGDWETILSEPAAVDQALGRAEPGDLLVVFANRVNNVLAQLRAYVELRPD